MSAGDELDERYTQATAALKARDYDRAADLLRQVLMVDENYKDASRLLAQAIRLKRHKWYADVRLWIGGGVLLLIGAALALTPRLRPSPPDSGAASTNTPTHAPVLTRTPTITPTPVPLSWKRVYIGQEWPRDFITAIAVDPTDADVIYVGTESAGIYKTIDGGRSWSPAHNGLGRAAIDTLIIDRGDPRRLYAGTLLGGVYYSVDGGSSWTAGRNSAMSMEWIAAVVLDPVNSRHLYFAAGADRGIYESHDGGETWSSVQKSQCPDGRQSLVVSPGDGNVLYSTSMAWPGSRCDPGVYRSADGGRTWRLTGLGAQPEQKKELWIDAIDGRTLYTSSGGLLQTSDAGESWHVVSSAPCHVLLVDPLNPDAVVCDGTRKSTDGGQTWSDLGWRLGDIWELVAMGPRLFAVGSEFFFSDDGGLSWTESSVGIGGTALNLVIDPQDGTSLILELSSDEFDCSRYFSGNGGATWTAAPSPVCRVTYSSNGDVLVSNTQDSLLRSDDHGVSWLESPLPLPDPQGVAVDPHDPDVVFALYGAETSPYIYRSTDAGGSWEAAEGVQPVNRMRLSFGKAKEDPIYAMGDLRGSRSDDGGLRWQYCQEGEIWVSNASQPLLIDPRDSASLLLATRGSGVMKSKNSCLTWSTSNTGLSSLFVSTLARDPNSPDTIYAATDGGAYVSFDGGTTWGQINDGLLGATVVYSIVVDAESNVYAATPYGIFTLESR